MHKIGKYEFDSREQAQTKIDSLGTATDEDGNEYPTHKNTIVHLGNIVLEQGEYDEEGEEITAPILSDKYCVDVLWNDKEDISIEDWSAYEVIIEGEGVHSFFGLSYSANS
jgi:hypothetical protein